MIANEVDIEQGQAYITVIEQPDGLSGHLATALDPVSVPSL